MKIIYERVENLFIFNCGVYIAAHVPKRMIWNV